MRCLDSEVVDQPLGKTDSRPDFAVLISARNPLAIEIAVQGQAGAAMPRGRAQDSPGVANIDYTAVPGFSLKA
jgi:hypothetical protein